MVRINANMDRYNEKDIESEIIDYRNSTFRRNDKILRVRPPIVSVMGHIDHGKTSLLDRICSTNVLSKETGGITQTINVHHFYADKRYNEKAITFLDTPGHSAFFNMRLRGIDMTDIVLLVIAIDDGIMQQTIETIQYAKSFDIPVIVAVNKIDKKISFSKDIENYILKYGVQSERLGGEDQFVYVSAKTGEGIDNLLEAILVQAELMELKADRNCPAIGTITESFLDKRRGPVVNVIIREGVLKIGQVILCGFEYGKVKKIIDVNGKNVEEALPCVPVQVLGLSDIPLAGDKLIVLKSEKKAKNFATIRRARSREIELDIQKSSIMQENKKNFFKKDNETTTLNIILKTDTQGMMDAIQSSLYEINRTYCRKNIQKYVKIIRCGVGQINTNDVILAITSKSIIFGFNVQTEHISKKFLVRNHIDIRYYSVIYKLLQDVEDELRRNVTKKVYDRKVQIGTLNVQNIFHLKDHHSTIVGCMVVKGRIRKDSLISIFRGEKMIFQDIQIDSLQRFQSKVNEVKEGDECGVRIKPHVKLYIGDVIAAFEKKNDP